MDDIDDDDDHRVGLKDNDPRVTNLDPFHMDTLHTSADENALLFCVHVYPFYKRFVTYS